MTGDNTHLGQALPSGYRLNNYQIQAVLGGGGFGLTYRARDLRANRLVAIKEYFPQDLAQRDKNATVHPRSQTNPRDFQWGLERFTEEARVLSKFKHINIVKVIDFFQFNNTGYIVMSYEKGQNLAQALKSGERAEPEEVMSLIPPLLDALEAVHKLGLLHRDIKPGNIYLRDIDNTPVLLDFGSARYDTRRRSQPLTSIVTRGYAPYEQYMDDVNYQGAWTDIYALGAVLYRCVTGKIPVDAPQRISAINNGQADPLPILREVAGKNYPNNLLKGIEWALEINQQDRPQTISNWRSVIIDLEWYGMAARRGNEQAKKWLRRVRRLAKQGNGECQIILGTIYQYGYGIRGNIHEAIKWYTLAGRQGNIEAQKKLGDIFFYGRETEADTQKAMLWYREAATRGDVEAEQRLQELGNRRKPMRLSGSSAGEASDGNASNASGRLIFWLSILAFLFATLTIFLLFLIMK